MARTKKFDSFLEEVEHLYGDIVIVDSEEEVKGIPTGSISLDMAIGVGGIPLRRFTEIYGPESSGKTTLALSISKNCIKEGGKVLYIDTEQGVDYTYAQLLVGDIDNEMFTLIQPETAEQALSIAEIGIRSHDYKLIILDSVGALASEKEKTDDLTDSNVALISRIMTLFLKRNAFEVRRQDVAFVFINQVRAKIGAYMGGYETPAGWALKHYLSLKIQLSKGTKITEGNEVVGTLSTFTIKKSKVGTPFKSYTIPVIFGKGIDSVQDTLDFAKTLGIITTAGSYYKFEGETIGQGRVQTLEFLNENPETLDKIVTLCHNEIKGMPTNLEEERIDEDE